MKRMYEAVGLHHDSQLRAVSLLQEYLLKRGEEEYYLARSIHPSIITAVSMLFLLQAAPNDSFRRNLPPRIPRNGQEIVVTRCTPVRHECRGTRQGKGGRATRQRVHGYARERDARKYSQESEREREGWMIV